MIKNKIFIFACKTVFVNRKQYLLAASGIIVGIIAQILSMSLSLAHETKLETSLLKSGVAIVEVSINSPDEYEAIHELVNTTAKVSSPVKTFQEKKIILAFGEKKEITIIFTEESYFDLSNVDIINGAVNLNKSTSGQNVVVINAFFSDSLNRKSIIGETMEIDGIPFVVGGIIDDGRFGKESACYLEYNYLYKYNTNNLINSWLFPCTSFSLDDIEGVEQKFNSYLQNKYYYKLQALKRNANEGETTNEINGNVFSINTKTSVYDSAKIDMKIIKELSMAFFALLLIVGTLCVRNIFKILSNQRHSEIGIAKASGALRKTILYQFIIEITCVIAISVFTGVLVGIILSISIEALLGLPISLCWIWIVSSALIASMLSLLFGVTPAFKCSKLDPITVINS